MDISEIKAFFKKDRFADMLGIEIDSITTSTVVCSMDIGTQHLNAANKVQGGATFSLADFTFAVACNYSDLSAGKNTVTVGQSCNIVFFKPATGKKLTAKSSCLQKGRKLSVYRVMVTDDNGVEVAEMTGNAYTVNLEKK